MEVTLCLDQLSHHLSLLISNNLSYLHAELIGFACAIVLAYLLIYVIKPTKARAKVAFSELLIVAINYSPLFFILGNKLYSLYALIHIVVYHSLTNKKIKSTLGIMILFEFAMAVDRVINAGKTTWLYDNMEEITIVIHCLVISSFFDIRALSLRKVLGLVINRLRGLSHSYSVYPVI